MKGSLLEALKGFRVQASLALGGVLLKESELGCL